MKRRFDEVAVTTTVTCEIYDSSGEPGNQIRHQRSYSGPTCVCTISAFNMTMPIRYCATVEATFSDDTTSTDRVCTVHGSPAPPESPTTTMPVFLRCLDPLGTRL